MKPLVLVLALVGCAAEVRPGQVDADRAVALARQAAAGRGYAVADYDLGDVTLENDRWLVFFDHKPPGYPGGHFFVYVARDGGAAELVPGK